MSTKTQRHAKTAERGLLDEDLHPKAGQQAEAAKANPAWAELVAQHGGASPFQGKAFLALVAGGTAGHPALAGAWPTNGEPKEWREAAGVTTLQVANLFQVPCEIVDAWEAPGAGEPFYGNWNGTDGLDDLSARRLYGAFKSYRQNGPYAPPPAPEPPAERPPVEVMLSADFPRPELLEAAALGYQVEPSKLAGEGRFLSVVVRGEVPGIPVLRDVPDGSELKRIREESGYTQERWGALLGAAASRIQAWEDNLALPGADVSNGGLAAALRLYGTCALIAELRQAEAK